jgi:hypothetical protein
VHSNGWTLREAPPVPPRSHRPFVLRLRRGPAEHPLVRHAADSAALDLLATELDSRNEWAATRAARALELLGEKARPKLDIMRDALKRRTSGFFGKEGPDPANYGLEFSLTMALKALEQPKR